RALILFSHCCFLYMYDPSFLFFFFFFTDPATTKIYTLSLHDALPISIWNAKCKPSFVKYNWSFYSSVISRDNISLVYLISILIRSEEHTSELQSRENLVCRLLLEKKKNKMIIRTESTI